MMPRFMNDYVLSCHYADFSDKATRFNILNTCVPKLSAWRISIIRGLLEDRKSANKLSHKDRRGVLADARQCGIAVRTAKARAAIAKAEGVEYD